jgi:hypothetical protein
MVPPGDLESLRWERNGLTLIPAQPLEKPRTYTLFLAAGMKDARGNRTPRPIVVHFTTGDSLPAGRLEGKIVTGRLKSQGVMVSVFDSERCPETLGEAAPDGLGQSDAKGEFSVGALPVDRSYCLFAHLDTDMNGEVDEGEAVAEADSLVTVTSEEPTVSGIEIYLAEADEPGRISGAIVDSARVVAGLAAAARDTVRSSFNLQGGGVSGGEQRGGSRPPARPGPPGGGPPPPDSTQAVGKPAGESPERGVGRLDSTKIELEPAAIKAARAESAYSAASVVVVAYDQADSSNVVQGSVDKAGTFALSNVKPGTYRLEIFRDLNGDRVATANVEPIVVLEGVVVRPVRTTDVGKLVLRWPSALSKDELQDLILKSKRLK